MPGRASSSQGPATRSRLQGYGTAPADKVQAGRAGTNRPNPCGVSLPASAASGKPALPGQARELLAVPCYAVVLRSGQHYMLLPPPGRGNLEHEVGPERTEEQAQPWSEMAKKADLRSLRAIDPPQQWADPPSAAMENSIMCVRSF